MKNIFQICLLFLSLCTATSGQQTQASSPSPTVTNGLYIGNGATLHISGGGSLTLLDAELENNGTLHDATGTINITGSNATASRIKGSGTSTLNNLTIGKTTGGLTLEKNIALKGNLSLTMGTINLSSGSIDFGNTGIILNENETNRILGSGGYLQTTMDLNAPNNQNPANLGAIISSGANWGNTIIKRSHAPQMVHGTTTTTNGSILRVYDIVPANNTNLNATVKLKYLEAELNGINEQTLTTWKSTDDGSNWNNVPSSQDAANNQLTVLNQNEMGQFTGDVICPAVSIRSNAPLCERFELQFDLDIQDTLTSPVYAWTGPNSFTSSLERPKISNISPSQAGTYTLTVTANGCEVTATTEVIVYPLPAIPTLTADNMTICKGQTVILTGNCSTANASFRWTTPPFNNGNQISALPSSNQRTITEPGTYKGLCESDKGCLSDEVSITINQATDCNGQNFITFAPEKPAICPGESIQMTASGCTGTLTWLGGPSSQTGTSVSFSPAATTTYLVNCSTGGSSTFTIVVASNTLAVGQNITTGKERFKAVTTLTSEKKVGNDNFTPGANVIYEAGNSITLMPGFEVSKWSVFKAEIKGCDIR